MPDCNCQSNTHDCLPCRLLALLVAPDTVLNSRVLGNQGLRSQLHSRPDETVVGSVVGNVVGSVGVVAFVVAIVLAEGFLRGTKD